MKNSSPYLKMQVLGAIEFADGRTIRERIKKVSETDFHFGAGFKKGGPMRIIRSETSNGSNTGEW